MMNYGDRKKLIISILFLLIISIGVGYAAITSNLSIAGNTEIASNTWDIHFANLVVNENSVEATTPATINPSNNTSITYTVKLNRPKDFYEFTLDVVNDGTLPGKVSISTLSGITSEAENIVDYTVTYSNGNPVQVEDILNGGAIKSIKVKVYYNDDIDVSDLPSTNLNLTLTYTLQYVQSEEEEMLNPRIRQLINDDPTCFPKYTGQVTDQVGRTVRASNVYYSNCGSLVNFVLNNMCWQMIRTTETGGIRLVYNGESIGGKCVSTADHFGVVQTNNSFIVAMNSNYLYSPTFTYDVNNKNFYLTDSFLENWSSSTYESLKGFYTCRNTSGVCTTLYYIDGYVSDTEAYASTYIIDDTNYASIGTSEFNTSDNNPAMVGYMFNKVYNFYDRNIDVNEDLVFGASYSYNTNTGMYTLINRSSDPTSEYYTCWNATGECSTISYIAGIDNYKYYYTNIINGKSIDDALIEMFYEDEVNKYNSSIKGIIDSWYYQFLSSYTNYFEDSVYCNDREITGSFVDNYDGTILFAKMSGTTIPPPLTCKNETDQFAVSNNKAKLTYPIALLTLPETRLYDEYPEHLQIGNHYWLLSPDIFYVNDGAIMNFVKITNIPANGFITNYYSIRPAITLKNSINIVSGNGTATNPFIIGE